MSWFHKDHGGKVQPILHNVEHTVILGAEVADGKLARMCYSGHTGVTETAIVQAIVPGGECLWRTQLAQADDVSEGHVAAQAGIVVTRVKHGKNHELIGHDMWTGQEKWRRAVGQMVTRMGVTGNQLELVTFDHVHHVIEFATGEEHARPPVMTDQAASRTINPTRHPVQGWSRDSGTTGRDDWSDIYHPADKLEVYERDWAGTDEFGIGYGGDIKVIGSGSYQGAMYVDKVVVLGFRLDRDGVEHHHWYLYAYEPAALLLAVLREDGQSELYDHGHKAWTGKL
jgi:hypothetical protein